MYEVPGVVASLTVANPLARHERHEIARRAVAMEIQKQITELTGMKDDYPGDTLGEKFIRAGLRSAIDHLRIRLAEVEI